MDNVTREEAATRHGATTRGICVLRSEQIIPVSPTDHSSHNGGGPDRATGSFTACPNGMRPKAKRDELRTEKPQTGFSSAISSKFGVPKRNHFGFNQFSEDKFQRRVREDIQWMW